MKKELGYDASGKQTNYLPIPTDDEGRPANPPDIRFDFKVYSEEQMLQIFKVVNPKRKPRAEMEFFPDLTRVNADGYYIAFDHNNTIGGKPLPVGRAGWKWLRKHKIFLTTGIKVIPMYRGMGIGERLWKERDRVIFRVAPAVGFLSNFSPGWINFVKSQYWNIEPPVSTLPPSLVAEAEKTITDPNKPRKMITYNLPGEIYGDEPMRKAWDIIKAPYRIPVEYTQLDDEDSELYADMENELLSDWSLTDEDRKEILFNSPWFEGLKPKKTYRKLNKFFQGAQEGDPNTGYWTPNIKEAVVYALLGSDATGAYGGVRDVGKPEIRQVNRTDEMVDLTPDTEFIADKWYEAKNKKQLLQQMRDKTNTMSTGPLRIHTDKNLPYKTLPDYRMKDFILEFKKELEDGRGGIYTEFAYTAMGGINNRDRQYFIDFLNEVLERYFGGA